MEKMMSLREILQKMVKDNDSVLLNDNNQVWEAITLLNTLPETTLKRQAYLQPGLYIAEINEKGYLGRVMYKVKQRI